MSKYLDIVAKLPPPPVAQLVSGIRAAERGRSCPIWPLLVQSNIFENHTPSPELRLVEENLVNASRVLAAFVSEDLESGRADIDESEAVFHRVFQASFTMFPRIWRT